MTIVVRGFGMKKMADYPLGHTASVFQAVDIRPPCFSARATTSSSIDSPAQAVLGCVENVLVRVEEAFRLGHCRPNVQYKRTPPDAIARESRKLVRKYDFRLKRQSTDGLLRCAVPSSRRWHQQGHAVGDKMHTSVVLPPSLDSQITYRDLPSRRIL
jgi:hypothetical protein